MWNETLHLELDGGTTVVENESSHQVSATNDNEKSLKETPNLVRAI